MLTKQELRRGFPDRFLPEGTTLAGLLATDRLLRVHSSSGTTDERVDVLYDERLNAFPEGARRRWRPRRPLGPFSKVAVLTSPICAGFQCHLEQKSLEERLRGRTLTCFVPANLVAARREHFLQFHEELERFRPDVLLVNPLYALWMGRGLIEAGRRPYSPALVLSSYQWLTPPQRAFIARAFDAPVYDYYSATDLGGAIVGFEESPGRLEINHRDVYVELLPLRGGEERGLGQLVVTTLRNRFMPLVRYLLEDLAAVAAWSPERGVEAIRLFGRSQETFVLPSGRLVTPADVSGCLEPEDDVAAVQLDEVAPGKVRVNVHPIGGDEVPGRFLERLERLFGGELSLEPRLARRVELARSLKSWMARPLAPLSRAGGPGR